jgi:2-dehydro-3-deoxyglucarate aldolase
MTSFRQRLKNNERLLGTMVTLPSAAVAELLVGVGFDWLFLDAEHGPLQISELADLLRAVAGRIPCAVRTPENSEAAIKQILDLGADAIIVPQVNSPAEAADVVKFAKYPPEGSRGVGLARAHGYGLSFQEYVERANEDVAVIVQAEHIDAVNQIEEIVEVPGIDGVIIGPYDLSASLNKMGQVTDPAVTGAIDRVTEACQNKGLALGIFGVSPAAVAPYMEQGYSMIIAGVDMTLLLNSAQSTLSTLREIG